MVGQFVLNDPEVCAAIEARGIVTLKADVTRANPEAYDLMKNVDHEAKTIPYFAMFYANTDKDPRTHSALLTKDDMLEFLNE